jgi:2-deoxy-D-gluconate 3-dehydrogenase
MVSSVVNTFGRIDILVNKAGIAHLNKAIDLPISEWDDVIETNLKSTFLMCKAAGKVTIKQEKGKIVNTGSVLEKWFQRWLCLIAL